MRGYSKWFGVDMLCAVNELKLSGVSFASESEQEIIRSFHQKIENKRKQKQLKDLKINGPTLELLDSDENFAFIVGRASNGAPYGVT